MYKSKIFDNFCVDRELADFLNKNNIKREDIVSITMSSDAEAHRRLGNTSVNRILLVWWEESPKPKNRIEEVAEARRDYEERANQYTAEIEAIGKELQATVQQWAKDYDLAQDALSKMFPN